MFLRDLRGLLIRPRFNWCARFAPIRIQQTAISWVSHLMSSFDICARSGPILCRQTSVSWDSLPMSRFDRCAVDSADEDKPTPVDFNADNQRPKCRPQIGTLDFPRRFRSSTLAISDDGTCCRHDRTREPSVAHAGTESASIENTLSFAVPR